MRNQDDYNRRYDEMVSRFEATKAERDALAAEIRQRGIRRREFERFITTLETLPDEVTDFSENLWGKPGRIPDGVRQRQPTVHAPMRGGDHGVSTDGTM